VGEFAHSFLGKELIPVLAMADDIVERRTGQSKGAVNMDADALQSSTPAAVAAAVGAAQAQQELLVRGFAECALKPMFRGILKLLVEHQPRAQMVRLRGKWAEVDPRSWDANMDVQVNVTLGSGLSEEKIATLMEISAKQEGIMQMLGQNNPLVNIKQYRDTLVEMIALRGRKDGSKYFKVVTDEQVQQLEQAAAQQPPPPDPEMMKAQAQMQLEQMKTQAQMQTEKMKAETQAQLEQVKAQIEVQREAAEAELAMALEQEKSKGQREIEQLQAWQKMEVEQIKVAVEREKMLLEDDRERDKQAGDIQLKIKEMELTHMVDLSELEITSQIERERIQSQAAGKPAATVKKPAGTVKAATPKPKKRRVTVERDPKTDKLVGATVEDVEGD
jgi:hypothetical protein